MIPEFPKFKKLELSDKKDVEKFTLKYPPYSDFNFAGTYSWDVRDQMKISQLNGNYVIKFIDYLTGEPFYTFLGENDVNDTAKKLLDLSIKEGVKPELKIVPEDSVKGLDDKKFKIVEDRDNFDYIYSLEELKDYNGSKFETKRREVRKFFKKYINIKTEILSLQDKNVQKNIILLYKKWVDKKIKNEKKKETGFDPNHELVVIKKMFSVKNVFKLISFGVFEKDKLIAFCIYELQESEYVISHIVKADPLFSGIYSFLMQKSAEILCLYNKKSLNYEQDLGIPSLQLAKRLFRPSSYLKKYIITSY